MRIGKTIETLKATSIITYKLIEYTGITTVYSIAKMDNEHDTIKWIAKSIHNKQAIDLIWNDVLSGLQK